MNQKLLNEHIAATTQIMYEPLKKDGSNAQDFVCADVVGTKKFAKNHGGYPRNDIALINEAASLDMQKALLAQLETVPTSDENSGLSDYQIMLGHKSKYQQAPSEMQDFIESQLKIRDALRADYAAKIQAAQAKKAAAAEKKTTVPADTE